MGLGVTLRAFVVAYHRGAASLARQAATALLLLAGVSVVVVGFFPCDVGDGGSFPTVEVAHPSCMQPPVAFVAAGTGGRWRQLPPVQHGRAHAVKRGRWWRITDEHRLVYKVAEDEIRIAACRYHYER